MIYDLLSNNREKLDIKRNKSGYFVKELTINECNSIV